MSIDKLRGQFIQGDVRKPKKPAKSGNDVFIHYLDTPSSFGGYKQDGRVMPKKK